MRINKKYILPANGSEMVFHEEVESMFFETDKRTIKSACEILHNLEEYPLLFAQLEDKMKSITNQLGTKENLNMILSEIIKETNVENNGNNKDYNNRSKSTINQTIKATPT